VIGQSLRRHPCAGVRKPPSPAPQDKASPLGDVTAGSVDAEPRPQPSPTAASDRNIGRTNESQVDLLLRRRRGDGQTERAEQKTVGGDGVGVAAVGS